MLYEKIIDRLSLYFLAKALNYDELSSYLHLDHSQFKSKTRLWEHIT